MTDEKAKYLIVDATDITKQLYQMERVYCCNDFYNVYHRTEKVCADDIFARNDVPEKFRKIIVKVSAPVFSKREAEEYTMGFPFDYRDKAIKEENNRKYIRMHNTPIYYNEAMFNDKIIFKTEANYTSFNNVIYLLEDMYNNGCLENYIQSIKEFFDISLDFGLLFDAWNETHNRKKALELYKYRIASRKL